MAFISNARIAAFMLVLLSYGHLPVIAITHRPPSVPIGAEWLNSMPKGGEFVPTNNQPVLEVNYRTCKTNERVVEYLYAEVQSRHLGKGTDTNPDIRKWVKSIGKNGDDAGHIIGKNQGGLGTVKWNIFPQSRNINRGTYASDVERVVHDAGNNGVVKMWYRFVYGDTAYPCRPTKFDYYMLSPKVAISNDLVNP